MAPLRVPMPVPEGRAAAYRVAGHWDDRTLADGIDAAAAARPDALALVDDERGLSWAALRRAVAGGIELLANGGVRAGDGVVLVAGNTAPAAIAFHSALRLGAPVLRLDRRSGAADLRMAREAMPRSARVVVSDAERERLGALDAAVIPLERFATAAATASEAVGREPDRDAPAVVLFTSGTTGRPKAVVHSINTLTAGAANMARILGAGPDDVLYLVSPLASITGVMQLLFGADQHAAVVLDDAFDPDRALDRINDVGPAIVGGAPVIAERLLDAARRRGTTRVAIRALAVGGAMLPRPILELATDAFGIEIARVYGSSEAPNFTGSTPVDDRESRLSDDGALMPGSEVRVGSSGHADEGLVRGPGVFLGYLDPEDNAAAFEDGWYRTGDLVEVHAGRLTVTGRLKEVVNRNGLKISPSEIDVALAGLPGAVELACFALPDATTGERLVVAVRPVDGATVSLDDVVAHLLARGVSRRKLPEQLVRWDGPLPRTPSGKIIRSRLVQEAPRHHSEVAVRSS